MSNREWDSLNDRNEVKDMDGMDGLKDAEDIDCMGDMEDTDGIDGMDNMEDMDFDALLQNSMAELPPDDVVNEITPWRKAVDRVLTGLAFNMITLNFLALDFILPTIGLILMLLGFRTLRRENGWFRGCWVITAIRSAIFFPLLVLNATAYQSSVYAFPPFQALTAVNLALVFFQLLCLWKGLVVVKKKVGLPAHADGAAGLMIWFVLICLLALLQYNGLIIAIIFVVAYVFIIRSLFRLSKELDEAGYAVQAAPVRIPDRTVTLVILSALALGIACAYLFGGSYPMRWEAVKPGGTGVSSQGSGNAHSSGTAHSSGNAQSPGSGTEAGADTARQAAAEKIKVHLTSLGFPAEILKDLTLEDIEACEGALQVVVDTEDHPVNEGREVSKQYGNTTHISTVYDVKELCITGIAVELPGERERWKLFHHFQWTVDTGFYGTEAIQLWPAYRNGQGWGADGSVTGQVLCTADGRDLAAPYYSLGAETYTSTGILWGEQTSTDVFAEFSMPRNSTRQRGYLSYTIREMQDDWIVDSWINYTHQRRWWQYPAMTAKEKRIQNSWNSAGAFFTVQDALQFYPTEGEAELLN